jgi:hypothetical protein
MSLPTPEVVSSSAFVVSVKSVADVGAKFRYPVTANAVAKENH